MTKAIGTVAALGTSHATYHIFLIMSHLMEDMCLLGKEDARLLEKELSKPALETLKKEKERVDVKLAGFLTASKDLDNLIESQRSDKNKEGLGYSAIPPQNRNPSVPETDTSPSTITPKPFIKFVKPNDSPSKSKKGPNFVMEKKACFNCGDFNHLAYDCRKRVKRGTSRS
nr:hypothetical protein [Tanacetum cinerariifolium]